MAAELNISQFDYHLPPELIAQHPTPERSASRLLHLDGAGALHDRRFVDLPGLLRAGDLLVFNNTRVIKARLLGQKASGGRVEVLVERVLGDNIALAHVRASKSPKPGSVLRLAAGALEVRVLGRSGELFELDFGAPVLPLLENHGSVPLPPYIEHAPDADDAARYQTVYASAPGAVAAPTAGLHFDAPLMARLQAQGIASAFVTLHVGAGTFQPVRVKNISEHVMHAERFAVPDACLEQVAATRAAGGRVIAVGTTSVRALEAAAQGGCSSGDTRLFITPGYKFYNTDALITNFHLPQSTLLMLVAALCGTDAMQRAYAHAVAARYRFFSYGDAMFIEPAPKS